MADGAQGDGWWRCENKRQGKGTTDEARGNRVQRIRGSRASCPTAAVHDVVAMVVGHYPSDGTAIQRGDPPAEFLQESQYCDWTHPAIGALGRLLTQRCASDTEKAICLFEWVRDEVMFVIRKWNDRASHTLAVRGGTCTNKTNLLVALARSVGIAAGYHVLRVNGKEYFGPITPLPLRKKIRARSTHVHAALYLNGRWVRCDPTDDQALARNTTHLNPQSYVVQWDGERDGLLKIEPGHILEDSGPLAQIDDILAKRPRLPGRLFRLGNLYVRFLRAYGGTFATQDALERAFVRWLQTHAPVSYLVYLAAAYGKAR
jgi:transglutaminase-like putative cysteine protease